MTTNLTVTTRVKIDWSQQSSSGGVVVSDVGTLDSYRSLLPGTGIMQANSLYHISGTLPSGGTVQFDLTNLTQQILGGTVTKNLTGTVKILSFENTSSGDTAGYNYTVRATGTNAFIAPFNGSGNVPINSLCGASFQKLLGGYTVSSSAKNFYLIDGGSGVNYEIAIIGVTGA